jgi:plastocyanin
VDIMVANTAFSDADVTIAPGTTVRWIWVNGAHTVTPDGHAEWTDADLDSPGDTLLHTFNTIGEFAYFCQPHQAFGMTGIIRVE